MIVAEGYFINQLCAFVDKRTKGDERKFIIAEMKYFESYLHSIVEYNQKGEHEASIDKFDANMISIHTYLILSEILKLLPEAEINDILK